MMWALFNQATGRMVPVAEGLSAADVPLPALGMTVRQLAEARQVTVGEATFSAETLPRQLRVDAVTLLLNYDQSGNPTQAEIHIKLQVLTPDQLVQLAQREILALQPESWWAKLALSAFDVIPSSEAELAQTPWWISFVELVNNPLTVTLTTDRFQTVPLRGGGGGCCRC